MGIGHSNPLENLLTIEKGISDTTLILLAPSSNKHTQNNYMESLNDTKG
jgi:hypothetical protein